MKNDLSTSEELRVQNDVIRLSIDLLNLCHKGSVTVNRHFSFFLKTETTSGLTASKVWDTVGSCCRHDIVQFSIWSDHCSGPQAGSDWFVHDSWWHLQLDSTTCDQVGYLPPVIQSISNLQLEILSLHITTSMCFSDVAQKETGKYMDNTSALFVWLKMFLPDKLTLNVYLEDSHQAESNSVCSRFRECWHVAFLYRTPELAY